MRLALVTDDPDLTTSLADAFAEEAIELEAFNAELALFRTMRAKAFDAVLIDAKDNSMLVNSLLSWRNCNADLSTPVIVLTPFSNWSAMLRWVNAGATDVASRFELEQVRLRVHVALQRRGQDHRDDAISVGPYTLRRDLGTLEIDGENVPLTPREFAMAWLFFSSPTPGSSSAGRRSPAASGARVKTSPAGRSSNMSISCGENCAIRDVRAPL